jgi:hypothetical protein
MQFCCAAALAFWLVLKFKNDRKSATYFKIMQDAARHPAILCKNLTKLCNSDHEMFKK